MNSNEIRSVCIDSAQTYYNYLSENGKGLQQVDVLELGYSEGKDMILKLRLSGKLFDTEAIFFKLLTNGKVYNTGEVRVLEYDSDKNILLIKPVDLVGEGFANVTASDLKVISDLKFLVERVKKWYELNGAFISLPKAVSVLSESFNDIEYLTGLAPSDNQRESLRSLFSSPFSYIWGAPGTGKTQFVLSYALLHYIRNKKKVAILAPTNNAIEQVLRGVLKMTDKAGIERSKILRLGIPSKKFAEEFPQVCEERGILKKLEEAEKQIQILERVVNYLASSKMVNRSEVCLSEFDKLFELERSKQNAKDKLEELKNKMKEGELDAKYKAKEIERVNKEIRAAQQKIHSWGHKLKKLFSSAKSGHEQRLDLLEDKLAELQKQKELSEYRLSHFKPQEEELTEAMGRVNNAIASVILSVKRSFEFSTKLYPLLSSLSIDNFKAILQQLHSLVAEEKHALEIDVPIFAEYKSYSGEQLSLFLQQARQGRDKLAASSTEERLNTVNVVACTLDGYVGRFTDNKLKVDHIFLDEAGYASIIKALPLFNSNVPVTFLGDHKQLPPVCEIGDWEMQRDARYADMFLWAQSSIFLESLFIKTMDEARKQYLENAPFSPTLMRRTSLNSTYRFGINLAKVLGAHVYDNKFGSSNEFGETQILFVHANKEEGQKSRISINEVKVIKSIINGLGHEDYVVLTPYTRQVKLLGQHLPADRNNLRILTVHGSQGREWRTVILSVVDTVDKWFVDSLSPVSRGLNLVNTAVSRSKQQLIIVCDNNYWMNQRGQLITDLIQTGKKLNLSLYQ
jgi:hypothetical protein